MKKLHFFLAIFTCLGILWAAQGQVNIFTGDKNAEIFIDGDLIAKEQVVKYSLEEGTHYLQIKKNNQVLKSQSFYVNPDKVNTVVADDFVDFKTKVASRGAIEVEAMRVRETRGNFAFGVFGGSPAGGLSLKWWPTQRIGLQCIGFVNNFDGNIDSRGGARILFALNESVFKGSTVTTYLAVGAGRSMLLNKTDEYKNETYDLSEASLGIEFKLADFFGSEKNNEYKHVVIDENTNPLQLILTQLITSIGEGFMKLSHFNLELGIERTFTKYYDTTADEPSKTRVAGKISGGFHIYF